MKRKPSFSKVQADSILDLINEKNNSTPEGRKSILEKISNLGFDRSKWNLNESYTWEDFCKHVIIEDDEPENKPNTLRRASSVLITIVVLLIPYPLRNVIEGSLDVLLVKPLLCTIDSSYVLDAVAFLVLCYLIFWFLFSKLKLRRNIDWSAIIVIGIVSLYIIVYRLKLPPFTHWDFTPIKIFPKINYIDIIPCLGVALVVYKLSPFLKIKFVEDLKYKLLDDAHITNVDKDRLSRKSLAEYLALHILNTNSDQSFAIGINAGWGEGKTSFQHMVGKFLQSKNKDIITIHFNPWKSLDDKKIIIDFFDLYSTSLRYYDIRSGYLIKSYSRKLLTDSGKWWRRILDSIFETDSQEFQFQEINKSLKKINKKIVVFVDDLDRLSHSEVIEVVKLIRNSANFRNTFFVVGYDCSYLKDVLKNHNDYGADTFLEKIFQIQLDLSDISAEVIKDQLKEYLLQRIPEFKSEIESLFQENRLDADLISDKFFGRIVPDQFIPNVLENIRDVKRFTNYFSLSIRLLSKEVVFNEYFYISLMRFKFPSFIDHIKRNKLDFFKNEFNKEEKLYKIDKTKVDKWLSTEMDNVDRELVLKIISFIFDPIGKLEMDRRSVLYPDRFNIYFDNALNTKGLLFGDFVPLLELDWVEIDHQLIKWLGEGKANQIIDVVKNIDPLVTIDRFEKTIKIWVKIINIGNIHDSHLDFFIEFINKNRRRILELYGTNGPSNFFGSLFNSKSKCFFYTTYIARLILRRYIDGKLAFYFPLPKTELQQITVTRLRQYISNRTEFDIRVFNLFYYNCWEEKTPTGNVRIIKSASRILRNYITKYIVPYLRFVIRPKHFPAQNEYVFEPFIPQYFNSWEEFERVLNETSKSFEEFLPMCQYFESFKESNYSEFYSEDLPIWLGEVTDVDKLVIKGFEHQTYKNFIETIKNDGTIQMSGDESVIIQGSTIINATPSSMSRESINSSQILAHGNGTFSIWGYVSDVHNVISGDKKFMYLVGYSSTNGVKSNNPSMAEHPNAWAIVRITPTKENQFGSWRFWCNNTSKQAIELEHLDHLSAGWHLFTVSWSHSENFIKLKIDTSIVSEGEFLNWPSDFNGSITIGMWPNGAKEHFFNSKVGPYMFTSSAHHDLDEYYNEKPLQ